MGKKSGSNHNQKGYIDEWEEWQDHQFDPGHYVGGKVRPIFKHPGKPIWVGIILIIVGLSLLILTIVAAANYDFQNESVVLFITSNLLSLVISIIMLIAGYRMTRRVLKNNQKI